MPDKVNVEPGFSLFVCKTIRKTELRRICIRQILKGKNYQKGSSSDEYVLTLLLLEIHG